MLLTLQLFGLLALSQAESMDRTNRPSAEASKRPAIPAIALERRLAERLGARVGDTLVAGVEAGRLDQLVVVAAIYEPTADPSTITTRGYYARFHLPELAALLGQPDRVDRFGVGLMPGEPPESVARDLNQLAFGFQAYSSQVIASESSQTFLVVSRFHQAIGVISVAASAIFLLCIMLLKVEERRRDAAVMRFTGVRRRTIFGALLLEAILVAGLGSGLGIGLALLASAATNAYYQRFFGTTLIFSAVTPDIVWFSVLLSLGLGIGAGSLAAWRLVRTRPMVLWGRG